MARTFVAASSQRVEVHSTVLASASTVTLSAWFWVGTGQAFPMLLGVGNNNTTYFGIFIADGTKKAFVQSQNGLSGVFDQCGTSNTLTNGVWQHVCARRSSGGTLTITLNGDLANQGSGTNSAGMPSTRDYTTAGALPNASQNFFDGRLADAVIWSDTLTDAEVAALASGAPPLGVHPTNVLLYWPLWGVTSPEADLSGNVYNGTVTGATLGDHAPLGPYAPPRYPELQRAIVSTASTASLSGTSAASFSVTGTLSVTTVSVPLTGTSALTFAVTAPDFLTPVVLTGTSAPAFTVTGTLTVGSAAITGTSHAQFAFSGTLTLPIRDVGGTAAIRFGVNGVPGVSVPTVTGPTGVNIIVRRPVLTVTIDGVEQTNIASASCHFGFDARFATAEIQYKSVSGVTPTYWLPVEITMGAGSHNVPRFYGYILPIDNTSFPKTGILRCRGPLGIAANLPNAANEWNPFSGVYGTDFTNIQLSGTFAKTGGSAAIVGTGTAFTTELAVGMNLALPGPEMNNFDIGNIVGITDDTHLTIDTNCAYTASGFSVYRGRMDQEIADFILAYYGLSSRYQFTAPFGGGFGDTVGGTGTFLGVLPTVPTWTWPMGTPGLDYLDQLDQACAAQDANGNWGVYKTFETVGGASDLTVFRTLITANPQASADDADFRLAEGVDLLKDMAPNHDPTQVVNGIRVVGGNPFQDTALQARYPFFDPSAPTVPWIPDIPATPPPYFTASSFFLPSFLPNNPTTGYPTVLRDFSFPMIERSIDDDSQCPWTGLTAEAKARQLLQELNTEVVSLRVSTYRDDVFGPGQTHYVYAPVRAGVFQTMWLNALDITMSDKRVFRQHMTYVVKN